MTQDALDARITVAAILRGSRGSTRRRAPSVPTVSLMVAIVLMTFASAAVASRPASGSQGMVASNHPLASLAGMQVLVDGGNAIDAAIAMGAALGVVEPQSSGLGGDGFLIVRWAEDDSIHLLNFSGRAPEGVDASRFREVGALPTEGPNASVVPGAAAGWGAAHDRFGTLPIERLLRPAIAYAEDGYVANAYAAEAHSWAISSFLDWNEVGARIWWGGRFEPPAVGEVIRNPYLAATYRALAAEGFGAFYEGPIAESIVRALGEHDGVLTEEDFASYAVEWEQPLHSTYRDYDLYTTRPNASGGLAAAQILNIVEAFDVAALDVNDDDYIHLFVEATKLAAADRAVWASDPQFVDGIPIPELLSKAYAEARASEIDPDRAATDVVAGLEQPGTTHVTVVDRAGNVVSMTLSLGYGWGSGFVAGETGVVLNNAMHMFDLESDSPVALEGLKRPRWNMAPMLIARGGEPLLAIGTPGGTAIWQVLPQVISRVLDHGMSLQDAIDAPRFTWSLDGARIGVESRVDEATLEALASRGHEPSAYTDWSLSMGGVNGIMIHPEDGRLEGATDPRRDGYVLGW